MEYNPYITIDSARPLPPERNPLYKKKERRNLRRIGWALVVYLIFTSIVVMTAQVVCLSFFPEFAKGETFNLLCQIVPPYLLGFPLFALLLAGMPKKAPKRIKPGFSDKVSFLAVTFFLMLAGNYIATVLMTMMETLRGGEITNIIEQQITSFSPLTNLILMVILAPIVEELMCRKLIIDRLLPYSETLAILTSGLFFGLLHGNFYQFFYAAFLGILFGYIYVKTGNVLHTILLHMTVNFTGSIIAPFLNEMTSEQASAPTSINPWAVVGSLYSAAMTLLAVCGIILLFRKRKSLDVKKIGDRFLTLSTQFKLAWCNSGTIVYLVICLLMFVSSLYI